MANSYPPEVAQACVTALRKHAETEHRPAANAGLLVAADVLEALATVTTAQQQEIEHYKAEGVRLSAQAVANRAEADRFKQEWMKALDDLVGAEARYQALRAAIGKALDNYNAFVCDEFGCIYRVRAALREGEEK